MLKNTSLLFSIFTLILFVSCAKDDPVSSDPVTLHGDWSAGEYTYSIDCAGTELTFDEYIAQLITYAQIQQTEEAVNNQCAGEADIESCEEEWYPYYMEFNQYLWESNPSMEEEIRSENTFSADKNNIVLNINSEKTCSMTYDGMCMQSQQYTNQNVCEALEANGTATWDGTQCIFTDSTTCEGTDETLGNTWDEGTSGLLTLIGDSDTDIGLYNIEAVNTDSEFHGKKLEFDGSDLSIELVTYQQVFPTYLTNTIGIDLGFTTPE